MKTKEQIAALILAARIEYHWWLIQLYRKYGERLIKAGERLDSGRMLRLNCRANCHGSAAKACERKYELFYVPHSAWRT